MGIQGCNERKYVQWTPLNYYSAYILAKLPVLLTQQSFHNINDSSLLWRHFNPSTQGDTPVSSDQACQSILKQPWYNAFLSNIRDHSYLMRKSWALQLISFKNTNANFQNISSHFRQEGQGAAEELRGRDFRKDLEDRERAVREKKDRNRGKYD